MEKQWDVMHQKVDATKYKAEEHEFKLLPVSSNLITMSIIIT